MATNTLATNIGQTIHDLNEIKEAIIEKGVAVPAGTKTSDFDDLIRSIQTGGGDISEYLQAAIRTVYVTNHGGDIDNSCEAFTKQIISYDGMWKGNDKIKSVEASFEKLVSGVDLFNCELIKSTLRSVKTNLDSLINGTRMFANNFLPTFEVEGNELPELLVGEDMFYNNNGFQSYGVSMPKLENGNGMFSINVTIQSFSSTMPNLKSGQHMFGDCSNLINFTSSLQSLQDGTDMFYACNRLTAESLVNILTTLPDRTGSQQATLTIGSVNMAKLTPAQIATGTNKNWNII